MAKPRPDTVTEEVALAPAQARRESEGGAALPPARSPRYNLKTVRAYLLKEAFQQLWDYSSPAWAGKFLDEWRRQTMRSRIEPMNRPLAAPAPGADSQLLPGSKADFQRGRGGPEQQG